MVHNQCDFRWWLVTVYGYLEAVGFSWCWLKAWAWVTQTQVSVPGQPMILSTLLNASPEKWEENRAPSLGLCQDWDDLCRLFYDARHMAMLHTCWLLCDACCIKPSETFIVHQTDFNFPQRDLCQILNLRLGMIIRIKLWILKQVSGLWLWTQQRFFFSSSSSESSPSPTSCVSTLVLITVL